jgi:hypothetical protein
MNPKLYSDAEEVKMLRAIVTGLRRGSCWCEMAIGNPMVREHSTVCKAATVIMGEPSDHFVLVPAEMVKQPRCAECDDRGYVDQGEGCVSTACPKCRP